MAKKKSLARVIIKLKSSESPHMYSSTKNKRNSPNKLELKKFDPTLRKHVMYKEIK